MHGPKRGHESDDDVYNKRVKKNTSTLTTINVAILDIINTVYDREKECTWDAEEVEVTLRLLETAHRTIGRNIVLQGVHSTPTYFPGSPLYYCPETPKTPSSPWESPTSSSSSSSHPLDDVPSLTL